MELSKTAGPVMRGPSSSKMWREWMITVDNKDDARVDVSLQAFMHPALEDEAKCLGFLSNYYGNTKYKGTCMIKPFGSALFLNATNEDGDQKVSSNPQAWSVSNAAESNGVFEIKAANKPDGCMKTLAVEDCNTYPTLVEDPVKYFMDSKKYKTWKLTRRYDLVPMASPPPPSPPPPSPPVPSPPPPMPIYAPIISGPSSTSVGYVDVRVSSFGGNNACSVVSIVFSYSASNTITQTLEVGASQSLQTVGVAIPTPYLGYNSIYVVGLCSNGQTTERSNGLSVYYAGSVTPNSPPPPPARPVYRVVGVNSAGTLWYNPDIDAPTPPWNPSLGSGFRTDACALSGQNAAAILVSGNVVYSTDNIAAVKATTQSLVTTNVAATSVDIGASKQGVYLSTSSPPSTDYAPDIVLSTVPAPTQTISSANYLQVSLSGTSVLGRTASALHYVSDISTGTPAWSSVTLPTGFTSNIKWISLSGTSAIFVEDGSQNIYYTSDVTAGTVSWTQVSPMPSDSDFGTNTIISASLAGNQIIFTVTTASNNIFVASDVTNPTWSHPAGQLDCVAIST